MVPMRESVKILDVITSGWGIALGILLVIGLAVASTMKKENIFAKKDDDDSSSFSDGKLIVLVVIVVCFAVLPSAALGALREDRYYAIISDLEEAYGLSFSKSDTNLGIFSDQSVIPSENNSYTVLDNVANIDGTEIYDKIQIKRDDNRNLTVLAPISEGSTQYTELDLVN